MNKTIPFGIGIILFNVEFHFLINDDPLNFDWGFEYKKIPVTVWA